MSMYTDTEHFVQEVMDYKNQSTYWSACNQKLAEQVYERVKQMIPEAKYYEFDGIQFITTNPKQEKILLKFFENLQDLHEKKLCEIKDMMCQILEEGV